MGYRDRWNFITATLVILRSRRVKLRYTESNTTGEARKIRFCLRTRRTQPRDWTRTLHPEFSAPRLITELSRILYVQESYISARVHVVQFSCGFPRKCLSNFLLSWYMYMLISVTYYVIYAGQFPQLEEHIVRTRTSAERGSSFKARRLNHSTTEAHCVFMYV